MPKRNVTSALTYLILATFFTLISATVCTAGNNRGSQIVVKYDIRNPGFQSIDITYFTLVPRQEKVIPIHRDTVFYDTVFSARPLYFRAYTNESIVFYAEPGSMIRIQIRPGDQLDKQVRFDGDFLEMNEFLLEMNALEQRAGLSGTMNLLPVEPYLAKLDSINLVKMQLLNRHQKRQPSHPFWKQQKEMIGVEATGRKRDFARFYFLNHNEPISSEWYSKLQSDLTFLFSKIDLVTVPMMQYYLDDFIAEKSSRMNNKWVAENQPMLKQEGFGKPNTWEFGAKYVIDSVASAEMRNYLLLKLVMRGLEKGELKPVRNLLELFYDNCTDKEMTGYIQKEVAEFQILQPGEFGPDIIGFDVDGKQVSLTGLKGKFIFVDVWATWCGPCLGQIPSFKKLANAYSGRNIVFIKYSVDDDRQKWSDFLGKNEPVSPDCLEWISENGTKCRLMDDYKFDAIPRYLFFDAKGRIINIWLESPGSLLNSKYLDKFLDHPDYQ